MSHGRKESFRKFTSQPRAQVGSPLRNRTSERVNGFTEMLEEQPPGVVEAEPQHLPSASCRPRATGVGGGPGPNPRAREPGAPMSGARRIRASQPRQHPDALPQAVHSFWSSTDWTGPPVWVTTPSPPGLVLRMLFSSRNSLADSRDNVYQPAPHL